LIPGKSTDCDSELGQLPFRGPSLPADFREPTSTRTVADGLSTAPGAGDAEVSAAAACGDRNGPQLAAAAGHRAQAA